MDGRMDIPGIRCFTYDIPITTGELYEQGIDFDWQYVYAYLVPDFWQISWYN